MLAEYERRLTEARTKDKLLGLQKAWREVPADYRKHPALITVKDRLKALAEQADMADEEVA